jgi:hypothetical protein
MAHCDRQRGKCLGLAIGFGRVALSQRMQTSRVINNARTHRRVEYFIGGSPTPERFQYRGYDILPKRQWSSWCVDIYRRGLDSDLPLLSRIDRALENLAKVA